MSLGLLVALENANRQTHRQDSCFISIDKSLIKVARTNAMAAKYLYYRIEVV